MEEDPPQNSSKKKSHKAASSCTSKQAVRKSNSRHAVEESGDLIECSGKQCGSCAAGVIADCVAVCCCPMAVVSLLALAFVKAPYMMGRRCLGRLRKKGKKRKNKIGKDNSTSYDEFVIGEKVKDGFSSDIVFEFGDEDDLQARKSFCAGFEAENVFLELFQVGHFGFGRVSYTEIQSNGKGN